MSSDKEKILTKDNLDSCLKEVAKEYRKRSGKGIPAEITLIGGASVLLNYGFRDSTTDIDAIIHASSVMKEAINAVGDQFGFSLGWFNSDFTRTTSYSPKLMEFSRFYKKYYGIMEVRTISGEYLIAMKLKSGRTYKKDQSDILGILHEHQKRGTPILPEQIKRAFIELYGSWDSIPEVSLEFFNDFTSNGDYLEMHKSTTKDEVKTRNAIKDFEKQYPNVMNKKNSADIIRNLRNGFPGEGSSSGT